MFLFIFLEEGPSRVPHANPFILLSFPGSSYPNSMIQLAETPGGLKMALPVTETTSALVRRQQGSDEAVGSGTATAPATDGDASPLAGLPEAAEEEAAATAVGDDDDVLRILDALPLDGPAPTPAPTPAPVSLTGAVAGRSDLDDDGVDDTESDWDGDAVMRRKDPAQQLQQRLGKKFAPAPSALRNGFKGPAAAYTSSSLSSFAEAAVVGGGHVNLSYPSAPDRCVCFGLHPGTANAHPHTTVPPNLVSLPVPA